MKKIKTCLLGFTIAFSATAQEIDSIFFHLYTDSLKKGTHNYINVDGKTKAGKWLPLTSTELIFLSSAGTMEGNNLIIPAICNWESVQITAILKNNQSMRKEIIIPIKKNADNTNGNPAFQPAPPINQSEKKKKKKNKSFL